MAGTQASVALPLCALLVGCGASVERRVPPLNIGDSSLGTVETVEPIAYSSDAPRPPADIPGMTNMAEAEAAPSAGEPESFPGASYSADADEEPMLASALPSSEPVPLSLLPLEGEAQAVTGPLADALREAAPAAGFTFDEGLDSSDALTLKGQVSAETNGAETAVVYQWDVCDPSGTALHRIEGRIPMPESGGSVEVGNKTVRMIADETLNQLAAWKRSRIG